MKIVILDGHAINPGDLSWDALRSLGELEVFDRTSEDAIVTRAGEADALLTVRTPLSARTLKQLERLRYVGAIFTGYGLFWERGAHLLMIMGIGFLVYGVFLFRVNRRAFARKLGDI